MTMPNLTKLSLNEAKKRIELDKSMPKFLQAALLIIIEALLTNPNDVFKEVATLIELCANINFTVSIPNIEVELHYILAICYREGLGIRMDIKEAQKIFQNIIQQYPNSNSMLLGTLEPHSYALVELAVIYIADGLPKNIDAVLDCLSTAASKGNSLAQYHLARLYKNGEYVVADPAKANEYLLLAARAGLAVAQYDLAVQYAISSKQDNGGKTHDESLKLTGDRIREAHNWFKLAAANGYPKANYRLGMNYEQGFAAGVLQKDFKRAAKHYLVFLQHISNHPNETCPAPSILLNRIYNFASTLIIGTENGSQSEENVQLGHTLIQALANKGYKTATKQFNQFSSSSSSSAAAQYSTSRSASNSPELAKIDSPLQGGTHNSAGRTPPPIAMGNSPKLMAEQNSSSNSSSSSSSSSSASSSSSRSFSSQTTMMVESQEAELENDETIEDSGDEELSDSVSIPSPSPNTLKDLKTSADAVYHTQDFGKKSFKSLGIPRASTNPALVYAPFNPPQSVSTIASASLPEFTNYRKHALVFAAFNPPKQIQAMQSEQTQSHASVVYCKTWAKQMLNERTMQLMQPQRQDSVLTFSSQAPYRQNSIANPVTSVSTSRSTMEISN